MADDYRCDLWGIGVIAYMMLTGSPPFFGNTTEEIHRMILEGNPDYTSSRLRNVSPAAIDFLQKLMVRPSCAGVGVFEVDSL